MTGSGTTLRDPFHCNNCGLDASESFCSCCGARIYTATGDSVATQKVRPYTTAAAGTTGKGSARSGDTEREATP